jgi:hypothetical protein
MSPASAYISVLHRYRSPSTVDLAHDAGTDAGTRRFVDVTVDMKLRMHHGDIRRE